MAYADDFAAKYYGQPIEAEDANYLDQCMDWAFFYVDSLGIPRETIRHLYAYQVFTAPNDLTRQYFDIVANTPEGVPPAGALVISGPAVGIAGHIEIALSGCTKDTLISAAQNWNYHSYVEKVTRGYFGVIGWLVPKTKSSKGGAEVIKPDQVRRLFQALLGREATVEDVSAWSGQSYTALLDTLFSSEEYSLHQAALAARDRKVIDLTTQLQSQQAVIDAKTPAPAVSWMATTEGKAALRVAGIVLGVAAAHFPVVQQFVSDPNVANALGAALGITLGSVVSDVKNPAIPNTTKGGN